MADWSLMQGSLDLQKQFTSDGSSIYVVDTDQQTIYKYTFSTDTFSTIANSGSWTGTTNVINSDSSVQLCWFKSDLYAVIDNDDGASTENRVYQYDGSGTSWTQVFSIDVDRSTSYFKCDSSYMTLILGSNPLTARHTTDGSSWSASTTNGNMYSNNDACIGNENSKGLFFGHRANGDTTNRVSEFQTGSWVEVYSDASDFHHTSTKTNNWIDIGGGDFSYSSTWSSFSTPTTSNGEPIPTKNITTAYYFTVASFVISLYEFDGSQWDSPATDTLDQVDQTATDIALIDLSNGDRIALTYNGANTDRIYAKMGASGTYTHSAGGLPGSIIA